MHLWTNPAKPRQQEEQQKALQLTSGRAQGHIRQLHQEPGKGSQVHCHAGLLQELPPPGEQDLLSHLTLLSLLQFPRVCSSANQSTTNARACAQPTGSWLHSAHTSLTNLNCEVAGAAALPRLWPGNTLGVTATP